MNHFVIARYSSDLALNFNLMTNETYITLRSTLKKLDKVLELGISDNSSNYIIYEFITNPFTNDEMEVLLAFKSLAENDITKSQVLVPWGDDPLFVYEKNKMLISHDLRIFLYYLIVFRLKESINSFLDHFKSSPILNLKTFNAAVNEMNFHIVCKLFTEIRKHVTIKENQEVEINTVEIRSILDKIKAEYDFSKIENI